VSIVANAPTTRKTVLVLGRSATGLAVPTTGEIEEAILVIALGWPLTEAQRSVLREAEDVARSARVVFDAHLVASPADLGPLIGGSDRLMLDAGYRESRRIRRALAR
jgi:hypothetical protein